MKSLKSKLVTIVAVIVIATVVVSNILSNYILESSFNNEIKRKHVSFSNAIASNVELFMQQSWILAQQLANSPSVYEFDSKIQTKLSAETKERNSFIDLIFIQDRKGMQTARSNGNIGDRSSRWWFKKIIIDQKPFISKSYYSLSGNIAVTSVFVPITSKTDDITGILGIDIKLNALQEIVEKFSSESLYAYIIDGQGTVVAHPDKSQVSELVNYKSNEKTILVKNSQGVVKLDANGNQITEKVKFSISNSLSNITADVLKGQSGFSQYENINFSFEQWISL